MGKCEDEFGIGFDADYAETLRGELLEMPATEFSDVFGSNEDRSITLVAFVQKSEGEASDFGFEWGGGMGHKLIFESDRDHIAAMTSNEFFELLDQHLYESISIFLDGVDEDNW